MAARPLTSNGTKRREIPKTEHEIICGIVEASFAHGMPSVTMIGRMERAIVHLLQNCAGHGVDDIGAMRPMFSTRGFRFRQLWGGSFLELMGILYPNGVVSVALRKERG